MIQPLHKSTDFLRARGRAGGRSVGSLSVGWLGWLAVRGAAAALRRCRGCASPAPHLFRMTTFMRPTSVRLPINARHGDLVGCGVSVSEATGRIFVGACGDSTRLTTQAPEGVQRAGAVYHVDPTTLASFPFYPPNPSTDAAFGGAIATTRIAGLNGDVVLIGAPGDAFTRGAAYVYFVSPTDGAAGSGVPTVTFAHKLTEATPTVERYFGCACAAHNGRGVVGARGPDTYPRGVVTPADNGAALVFDLRTGAQLASLLPVDSQNAGLVQCFAFGAALAMHDDFILVGAPRSRYPCSTQVSAGAAFVFDTDHYEQVGRVLASDAGRNDGFGGAVALRRQPEDYTKVTLLIGAPGADVNRGAVYGFGPLPAANRSAYSNQILIRKHSASASLGGRSRFGHALAMHEGSGLAVITAPRAFTMKGSGTGASLVLRTWVPLAPPPAPPLPPPRPSFPESAMPPLSQSSQGTPAASSPVPAAPPLVRCDSSSSNGGCMVPPPLPPPPPPPSPSWTPVEAMAALPERTLWGDDTETGDTFGASMALTDDGLVIVGAPRSRDAHGNVTGAAYFFRLLTFAPYAPPPPMIPVVPRTPPLPPPVSPPPPPAFELAFALVVGSMAGMSSLVALLLLAYLLFRPRRVRVLPPKPRHTRTSMPDGGTLAPLKAIRPSDAVLHAAVGLSSCSDPASARPSAPHRLKSSVSGGPSEPPAGSQRAMIGPASGVSATSTHGLGDGPDGACPRPTRPSSARPHMRSTSAVDAAAGGLPSTPTTRPPARPSSANAAQRRPGQGPSTAEIKARLAEMRAELQRSAPQSVPSAAAHAGGSAPATAVPEKAGARAFGGDAAPALAAARRESSEGADELELSQQLHLQEEAEWAAAAAVEAEAVARAAEEERKAAVATARAAAAKALGSTPSRLRGRRKELEVPAPVTDAADSECEDGPFEDGDSQEQPSGRRTCGRPATAAAVRSPNAVPDDFEQLRMHLPAACRRNQPQRPQSASAASSRRVPTISAAPSALELNLGDRADDAWERFQRRQEQRRRSKDGV